MKNDEDITDLPVLGQEFLSEVPMLGGVAPAPRGTTGAPSSSDDEDDALPDLGASGVPFPPYGRPQPPARSAGLGGTPTLGAATAPPLAPVAVASALPQVVASAVVRPQVAIGGVGEVLAPAPTSVATATPAAPAGGFARRGASPAVDEGGVRLGGYGEDVAEAPVADVLVVHGTGKVVVPPDSACVEFHVEARGNTAEAARSKGAEALESALAGVKAAPLGKTSITLRTESVRTYPEYEHDLIQVVRDFDQERMRKVVGYHARGIRLRDDPRGGVRDGARLGGRPGDGRRLEGGRDDRRRLVRPRQAGAGVPRRARARRR